MLWQIAYYSLILVAGLLTGRLLELWKKKVRKDDCIMPQGLPVLGHAIALGRLGTTYIRACRDRFGPAFSLRLAGQRMCFLFEPHHIEMFFKAPESQITFRPAVEQFTQRVFGLPSRDFFPKHAQILTDLRHMLTPSTLRSHAQQLAYHAEQHMDALLPAAGDSQVELFAAVRKLVFRSAVPVLFGSRFAAGSHTGFLDELEDVFVAFEAHFEMAASPIPHFFQPDFTKARAQLLTWFADAHGLGLFEGTPVGELLQKADLGAALAPHLLLALLWASQANTVPATFWALAMVCLPQHQEHLQAIRDELWQEASRTEAGTLKSEIEAEDGSGSGGLGYARILPAAYKLATNRRSCISRCVAEAMRLRVQSLDVRFAADHLTLSTSNGNQVAVPKGSILALCPYEIHHDHTLFPPAADTFDPNRVPMSLGDGHAILPSVAGIAFGGGAYRCPGRFFAEMEVALLVQLVLACRELVFVPRPPADAAGSASAAEQEGGAWELARSMAVELLGSSRAFWGLGLLGSQAGSSAKGGGSQGGAGGPSAPSSSAADSSCAAAKTGGVDASEQCPGGQGGGCSSSGGGGGGGRGGSCQEGCATGGADESKGSRGPAAGGGALPDLLLENKSSGDPGGLLPPPDHLRLVGMKVPAAPCMVKLTKWEEDYLVV